MGVSGTDSAESGCAAGAVPIGGDAGCGGGIGAWPAAFVAASAIERWNSASCAGFVAAAAEFAVLGALGVEGDGAEVPDKGLAGVLMRGVGVAGAAGAPGITGVPGAAEGVAIVGPPSIEEGGESALSAGGMSMELDGSIIGMSRGAGCFSAGALSLGLAAAVIRGLGVDGDSPVFAGWGASVGFETGTTGVNRRDTGPKNCRLVSACSGSDARTDCFPEISDAAVVIVAIFSAWIASTACRTAASFASSGMCGWLRIQSRIFAAISTWLMIWFLALVTAVAESLNSLTAAWSLSLTDSKPPICLSKALAAAVAPSPDQMPTPPNMCKRCCFADSNCMSTERDTV